MLEDGYHGVGLQQILKDAGISKGSFYHYFKSKEDFGAAVIEYYSERFASALQAAINDTKLSPLQRLRLFFQSVEELQKKTGQCKCCLIAIVGSGTASKNQVLRATLQSSCDSWIALVAGCISEAQKQGEVDRLHDAYALAQFIHDAWEGALVRTKIEQSWGPVENFITLLFDNLLAKKDTCK